MEEQHLVTQAQQRLAYGLFRVSLQCLEFTAAPLGRKLIRLTPLSAQITVTMIIPTNSALSNFFSLGDAMWLAIPSKAFRIHFL
jgi:hypothetical protein